MKKKLFEEEYIICAANHYDDGLTYTFNATNITTGFIICGHRHHNCISDFAERVGFPYSKESQQLQNTEVQGFLTSTNRFVERNEAAKIAQRIGQIDWNDVDWDIVNLYSEDLY